MAVNGRMQKRESYVYGNTARVLNDGLQQKPQYEIKRKPMVGHTVMRNRERALQMDLPYVVLLTIAVFCALSICMGYLQMQSSISTRIHNIEVKELQLEQLKSENDALLTSINTDIDLDYVYQVATEELGMVYANRSQVLLYDKTESEYVRQYEDIPQQ